jgi:hypothetical protein
VYRKSDSAILVMKTAEDRLRCDDAEALNRARERGIFAQRAMNSRLVVISGVGFSSQRKWASPKITIWSTHSRRIDPINRSGRMAGRGGRVLEEEAQHLSRGVWALRIGVGANGAASRPSMSGSMDVPVLKDCPPARVSMDSARI